MNLNRRIRTLLYDDQRFTDFEIDLLHTPAMQRLYDLHQLGYADRVFVDASHSRLHHVIGVVEQADKMMLAIIRNLRKQPTRKFDFGDKSPASLTGRQLAAVTGKRRSAVRLMAFLHDLTHAPYGHTLEDEIRLVEEKHDAPHRQADAFYRVLLQYLVWIERNERRTAWGITDGKQAGEKDYDKLLEWYMDAPDIHMPPDETEFIEHCAKRWASLLNVRPDAAVTLRRLSPPALRVGLADLRFAMASLLHLSAAHKEPKEVKQRHLPAEDYPALQLIERLLGHADAPLLDHERFNPNRDAYLLDVIGNTICADLLDYARRDSTHAGLKLAYDADRIMANMTVVSTRVVQKDIETKDGLKRFPFNNDSLRTAVSIFSHKLRLDVPGELLNLLQVRFFVYERLLYHSTKCIAGAMLGAAMQNIGWRTLPSHWRYVGDIVFAREAREAARFIRDTLYSLQAQDTILGLAEIDAFEAKLKGFPDTGLTEAIRHWIQNRSKISRSDLIARLAALTKISRNRAAAVAMHKAVVALANDNKLSEEIPTSQWGGLRSLLLESAKNAKSSGDNIVDVIFPTVSRIAEEVGAGVRLLDRLAARRFHKVIFRLLPNASQVNGGTIGLEPSDIAQQFLQPTTRRFTEWAIAHAAGLPRGSVVIHCPPAEGPKKVANILMTDGKSAETPKLRDLNELGGKLGEDLFKHHKQAVITQEEMYKSTWRLSVSVAPPYDADWKKINPIIGKMIYSALGGSGEAVNDPHMVRELEGQVLAVSRNYERDLAANRRRITDEEDLSELANGVVDLLGKLGIEVDSDPYEILKTLEERLGPSGAADSSERKSVRLWKNRDTIRERLDSAFGPLFKKSDRRSALICGQIVDLSPTQQEWLDKQLEEHAFSSEASRVVTEEEKEKVFERVGSLIEDAKAH